MPGAEKAFEYKTNTINDVICVHSAVTCAGKENEQNTNPKFSVIDETCWIRTTILGRGVTTRRSFVQQNLSGGSRHIDNERETIQ